MSALAIPDPRRFTLISELPEGLHSQVPASAYHVPVLGMVSKSALEAMVPTPAHYIAWLTAQSEERTKALAFGAAAHCAFLEPDVFLDTYATEPDFGDLRFKVNKEKRLEFRTGNTGKMFVSAPEHAMLLGMSESIRRHPLASAALQGGEAELTSIWRDKETGLKCRARADYYVPTKRLVVDVKTCEDASVEGFSRAAFRYNYHWQHAIYRAAFPAEHFLFIAVEKSPPYAVALHQLDDAGVRAGYTKVRDLMRTMAECIATDSWPAYADHITTLITPKWAEGA